MFLILQLMIFVAFLAVIALTARITGKYKSYFFIAVVGIALFFLIISSGHYNNLYFGFAFLACISVIAGILKKKGG